ncbi:hypothetical protein [Streptomyces sp. NPDC127092]|uniref:hypothetical protein n=1 Tax=Streptomyces sp. NPDC127092 TaxID=3347135 RepID=UPI00364668B6
MKDEAKELVKGWGLWLAMSLFTIDDRRNKDLSDTISLLIFGIVTLVVVGWTLRYLYQLARVLYRLARASLRGRPRTAPGGG